MKRFGYLFEKIIDKANLKTALINTVKHKKHPKRFHRYIAHIDSYVDTLYKILSTQHYEVLGNDHVFQRYDNHRRKWRTITAPAFFPDQIIHTAILQVIEPYWLQGRYQWSCCGIKGKGIISAYRKIRGIVRNDKRIKYVAKLDLQKCYESVNRTIVLKTILRRFKDPKLIQLLHAILNQALGTGLPIGYSISVRFLEYLLQPLDYYIKQILHIRHYIRFADDMLLIDTNKRKLRNSIVRIRTYLTQLNLCLNNKYQIYPFQFRPIDFVGFKYHCNKRILLRKYTILSLLRTSLKVNRMHHCCVTQARSFVCRYGLLRYCCSKKFYLNRIKPRLSFNKARTIISNYDRRRKI